MYSTAPPGSSTMNLLRVRWTSYPAGSLPLGSSILPSQAPSTGEAHAASIPSARTQPTMTDVEASLTATSSGPHDRTGPQGSTRPTRTTTAGQDAGHSPVFIPPELW